ncbi:hypothetical protein BY996DRAFT_6542023 [Phakopsora pachyrhizi]|nr:hypothetical protein BY996DRAFT_6542023 [Phakopsora pachyrhizi]
MEGKDTHRRNQARRIGKLYKEAGRAGELGGWRKQGEAAGVVEDLVKEGREKEGGREVCWILQGFEEEGVALEGNGWRHWNEEQGGGAHQGQSGCSKTTGAMDL